MCCVLPRSGAITGTSTQVPCLADDAATMQTPMTRTSAWIAQLADHVWYEGGALELPLLPLATLFGLVSSARRQAYRHGWLHSVRIGVPVIVIGNITAGGVGKTPLVMWVVERLRELGFNPGIVSRGYGGEGRREPVRVNARSDPRQVGDEPVLMAARLGCPVAVSPDRVAAAGLLLPEGVNVIVADDGLQHYRLARDIEIAVVDGARGQGNGRLLPAGPLREPVRRLKEVSAVIVNDGVQGQMRLCLDEARPLLGGKGQPLSVFRDRTVHAVAGIGHPRRFFDMLRAQGLDLIEHPFPDHHRFMPSDLDFGDDAPVLMTEKDAVKCRCFERPGTWIIPARACLSETAANHLMSLFHALNISPAQAAR